MACETSSVKPAFFLLLCFLLGAASAQLSSTFYSTSCPSALSTIKSGVSSAVLTEARMGASLLRLHFHDCFVNPLNLMNSNQMNFEFRRTDKQHVAQNMKQGCDASNLLDDTADFTGEKNAGPNVDSIRGYEVIDMIKSQLERKCPGIVSCADILTVVARDSVVALGGPSWTVSLGRRDSTTASQSAANSSIPAPTLTLGGLISVFSNKGFTAKEMVALLGSHTIGQARCTTFRTHLYNENNINDALAMSLKANCPISGGDNNLSPLDTTSLTSFDNAFFKNLQTRKVFLQSDQKLFSGGSTDAQVNAYRSNLTTFKTDFANAMVKMGNLSLLIGSSGQIRKNCRKVN